MPIDDQLLEILCCPETQQPLTLASSELLARLNDEITAERLRTRGGVVVKERIEEGLLREDGRVLYVIDDGIPVMLIEESIELA